MSLQSLLDEWHGMTPGLLTDSPLLRVADKATLHQGQLIKAPWKLGIPETMLVPTFRTEDDILLNFRQYAVMSLVVHQRSGVITLEDALCKHAAMSAQMAQPGTLGQTSENEEIPLCSGCQPTMVWWGYC